MAFQKGDYVARKSYNCDTVFQIINIVDDVYYLKGVQVRLYADAEESDLVSVEAPKEKEEEYFDKVRDIVPQERNEYFYLPGKILHLDGDADYLKRCLEFYKKAGVLAFGYTVREEDLPIKVKTYLEEINPDIIIITGHDAYYQKKGAVEDLHNYKNSEKFVKAVKEARRFEKSHEKLVVIAGACQSNYEELIKAGANFASSPKRVNIHALDPAIIAVSVALTERTKEVNLLSLLDKTKYGKDGMGGLKCNGLMYVGYPR